MASRNRGNPKLKLQDISHIQPTKEDKDAIIQAFPVAPPIAAAILGGVLVEYELEASLRERFSNTDDGTWRALLTENGPLSSFYGKILLGSGFRLYDEGTRHNLQIVRKIRNAFAHAKVMIDFDHSLIIEELHKIEVPVRGRMKKFYQAAKAVDPGGKVAYVNLCMLLAGDIIARRHRSARSRRWRKRRLVATLAQSPLWSALQPVLMPDPTGSPEPNPVLPPGPQSVDPKSPIRRGALSGLMALGAEQLRKK